jgi:hypothetical protein
MNNRVGQLVSSKREIANSDSFLVEANGNGSERTEVLTGMHKGGKPSR